MNLKEYLEPETKYKNKKVMVDGIPFDSTLEGTRYSELKILEKANIIQELELQPVFVIHDKFKRNGKTIRDIKYIADFKYLCEGVVVVEDVKGKRTEAYQMKKKMFMKANPNVRFIEIYKDRQIEI